MKLGTHTSARGFSLLEVIVVLGVLGLLLQLLLPALLAGREAARELQCRNHLRQIGNALLLHHDAFERFPSGGWHFTWIGEPERGTDRRQPGSWAFNLLAYLDESDLRAMGRELTDDARELAIVERCRTALPVFHCPSRRGAERCPQTWNQYPLTSGGRMKRPLEWVAKSDYAANSGDTPDVEFDWRWSGPESLAAGDNAGFSWPDIDHFTGVIYGRSEVRSRQIRDGAAQTYLVGEKYVDPQHYATGKDFGDNENLYAGFNNDTCRSTWWTPRRDERGRERRQTFGSAHLTAWNALLCNGAVRPMSYAIEPRVHRDMGSRSSGSRVQ